MTILDLATDGPNVAEPGVDHWDAAVRAALHLLELRPLHEVSLEHVAAHIGVPVDTVRGQIPDMNQLLIAAIQKWNSQRMARVAGNASRDGAVSYLRNLLVISVEDPTCTRMVLTAAAVAGAPNHPASASLRQMWIRFHATVQRALVHDVAEGREPETIDPAAGAEQLLAVYEGLQCIWLFRPHMDLLAAYDRASSSLRDGWTMTSPGSVWNV